MLRDAAADRRVWGAGRWRSVSIRRAVRSLKPALAAAMRWGWWRRNCMNNLTCWLVTCRPGTSVLVLVVEEPILPAHAAARRRGQMPASPVGLAYGWVTPALRPVRPAICSCRSPAISAVALQVRDRPSSRASAKDPMTRREALRSMYDQAVDDRCEHVFGHKCPAVWLRRGQLQCVARTLAIRWGWNSAKGPALPRKPTVDRTHRHRTE